MWVLLCVICVTVPVETTIDMADKYYIIENDLPSGPFTLEELRVKCIPRDTRVWVEGQSSWVEAGSVDGLRRLFEPSLYHAPEPEVDPRVEKEEKEELVNAEKKPGGSQAFGQRHFSISASIIIAVIIAVIALVYLGVRLLPTTSVIIK